MPLEDVARAAGVGVATLYRRFPTRTDLAIAAFERNMSSYIDTVEKALANPQPWEGFRDLVFDLCALQASDPGLRALLTTDPTALGGSLVSHRLGNWLLRTTPRCPRRPYAGPEPASSSRSPLAISTR